MKTLFLLATSLLTTIVFAQTTTLKITESPEFKDKKKALSVLAIHTNKNNKTAVLRSSKNSFIFNIYV